MEKDFTKEFFQQAWGNEGYYEHFSYGVGIDKVCEVCLTPFFGQDKTALEIGCGGGVFTERLINKFWFVIAVDVIKMPIKFNWYNDFCYKELPDKSFDLPGIQDGLIDFCFSYNVFCHLSNEALAEYIKNVNRVLKQGADFVFMIANFEHSKVHFVEPEKYKLGDMLPMGHFYQDERTLGIVADKDQWQIISPNLIPEHRDIIIHLRKM